MAALRSAWGIKCFCFAHTAILEDPRSTMWVAGVLNGRESREVISSRRNLRFFLGPEGWSPMSASARLRFLFRPYEFGHLGKDRWGRGREPAVKVKIASRGEDDSCGAMRSMLALGNLRYDQYMAAAWNLYKIGRVHRPEDFVKAPTLV
jgi:hypothetical protein